MPLDPAIALQARPPQLPVVDPMAQAASLAQLAGLLQQQQAGRMALEQATEERQARRQLKDLYASGLDLSTPEGQQQSLQRIGAIDPEMRLKLGKSLREERLTEVQTGKERALTQKAQADTKAALASTEVKFFDLQRQKLDFIYQTVSGATPETWGNIRQLLVAVGVPPTALPEQVNDQMIKASAELALTQKDRLDALDKRLRQQRESKELTLKEQQQTATLERDAEREARLAREVVPIDTGVETVLRPRFPQGGDAAQSLPSAKGAAPLVAARTKAAEAAIGARDAIESMQESLRMMADLEAAGLYDAGILTPSVIEAYRQGGFGSVAARWTGYDAEKLARTIRYLDLGAGLPLNSQGGRVAAQVSDAEQRMIARAVGDLSALRPKNVREKALADLQEVTDRKAKQVNATLEQIEQGQPLSRATVGRADADLTARVEAIYSHATNRGADGQPRFTREAIRARLEELARQNAGGSNAPR